MKRPTTNRFLANALRAFCCIGALTACSAWASIIDWRPTASTTVATKESLAPSNTNTKRGLDIGAETSNEISFAAAPQSAGSSESSAAPVSVVSPAAIQQEAPVLIQSSAANSSSTAPEASFSTTSTSAPAAQPPPELGEAMASAFDEEFVSVPTVQFTSVASNTAGRVSAPSIASVSAVPEMSALFPIIGLIAAVSCTHILRRRRAAQKTASIV